jgi:hypothetical protein
MLITRTRKKSRPHIVTTTKTKKMVDSSSEQCCTIPVPQTTDVYSPKGEYISITEGVGGPDSFELPVYVAGAPTGNTKKALVCIYGKASIYISHSLSSVVD